jgi:hypothetical protein
MAGLVPAIHVPGPGSKQGVDHRDEPGDDDPVEALFCTAASFAEPGSRGARPGMTPSRGLHHLNASEHYTLGGRTTADGNLLGSPSVAKIEIGERNMEVRRLPSLIMGTA